MIRGGSWNNNASNCRSAIRNRNHAGNRDNNLGFRLAFSSLRMRMHWTEPTTFQPGRANSVELAEFLLEEARVAVVPGSAFGADDHIRLSFATSLEELGRGIERIAAALR